MSNFLLFRCDFRLVHGQVCTAWIPQKAVKRVVIVHDEYSKDPFLVDLHAMVVPKGVKCDTLDTQEAAKQWQADRFGDQNTIVIFQDPAAALKALDAGIGFDEMQVATMSGPKNSVTIYKQVNVTPENGRLLQELIERGVDVYCQMYPEEPRASVKELISQPKTREKLGL